MKLIHVLNGNPDMHFLCTFRTQYAILKEECRTMFPVIGSGRYITAPVITEDGDPILDPLVLQEAKAAKEAKEATSGSQGNGNHDDVEFSTCVLSILFSLFSCVWLSGR